jgi:hypothetical protein
MYTISHQLYLEVAERLVGAIGSKTYFSGVVTFTHVEVDCRLVCTLFIERTANTHLEGNRAAITKIIPVWWEFHTTIGSEELLNDFSFKELLTIAL